MKPIRLVFLLASLFFFPLSMDAQGSLPDFSVTLLTASKTQISWKNPYPNCIQLSIQKSSDSLTNFRTIYSAQSPQLNQNGFVDNRPNMEGKSFYRIFYVIKGMGYFFTKSKNSFTTQPIISTAQTNQLFSHPIETKDSVSVHAPTLLRSIPKNIEPSPTLKIVSSQNPDSRTLLSKKMIWPKMIFPSLDSTKKDADSMQEKDLVSTLQLTQKSYLVKNGIIIDSIPLYKLLHFMDSIKQNSKDTLIMYSLDTLILHPVFTKLIWKPSQYIYTNPQGHPMIHLPNSNSGKYLIKFFEETGVEIFSLKDQTAVDLVLDKSIFIHEGWFYFEIYLGDRLLDKNKLWIPKNELPNKLTIKDN